MRRKRKLRRKLRLSKSELLLAAELGAAYEMRAYIESEFRVQFPGMHLDLTTANVFVPDIVSFCIELSDGFSAQVED